MAVIPGSQPYACNANWKLMVENSIDGYHGVPVHQTYFEFLGNHGDCPAGQEPPVRRRPRLRPRQRPRGRRLPGAVPARGGAWHPMFGDDAKADDRGGSDELVARHGQERA